MWILDDHERVLTNEEWVCIRIGLEALRSYMLDDPDGEYGFALTGVEVFDQLGTTQKLAILADTCEAMTSPTIAAPKLSAVNEGTVAALLQSFWNQLIIELDMCEGFDDHPFLECRRALLAAFEDDDDPDTLAIIPEEHETDSEMWHDLFSLFESRFLDDTDYEMASLLDAPIEKAEGLRAILGIDDDYFVSVAPDPTERQMNKVNQKLAKLLDLPCPDDEGRFPTLYDGYSGLSIGPCTADEISEWSNNPWIKSTSLEFPQWDCEYTVWKSNFMNSMLRADPSESNESAELVAQRELRRQAALESIGRWTDF